MYVKISPIYFTQMRTPPDLEEPALQCKVLLNEVGWHTVVGHCTCMQE